MAAQIKISANTERVTVDTLKINTGEYNARSIVVALSEDYNECDRVYCVFTPESKDELAQKCLIENGTCTPPYFKNETYVTVGVFGEVLSAEDDSRVIKRYSPRPSKQYLFSGSYVDNSEEPVVPTPDDYSKILNIVDNSCIKTFVLPNGNINIKDLQPGFYAVKNTQNIKFYYGESSYLSFNIASIIIHDVVKDILNYRFFIVNTLNKSYIGHSAIGSRGDLIYGYDCREFPKKSDKFEIVITESSGNYTKNKSFSEISEALNENVEPYVLAYIHVLDTTVPTVFRYSAATESKITFSTTITEKSGDEIQLETASFILSSDESIEYYSKII